MQQEAIIAWAKARMLTSDQWPLEPGYRYYHGQRVAQLAQQLAIQEGLAVNRELLLIGGLLHDVGKAGDSNGGHGPRGAQLITEQIADLFSENELAQVSAIVANHYMRPKGRYMRDQPETNWPVEVLLVQDADTLDHFGANGIWISLHWTTLEKRNQAGLIARHYQEDKEWREEARIAMNYGSSLAELEQRIFLMDSFVSQLQREGQGTW